MTQQEFKETKWYKGIKCNYKDVEWLIRYVNNEEYLLGLWPEFVDPDDKGYAVRWVRCESVEIIND
jgi:hypothetical protein